MSKFISIKTIVVSIIIVLVCIVVYRTLFRTVIEVKFNEVSIEPLIGSGSESHINESAHTDFEVSEIQAEEIREHPNEYKLLLYRFEIKNVSENLGMGVNVKPAFSKDIKKYVVGYQTVDYIAPIVIEAKHEFSMNQVVIVKTNGLSDEEFIKLAKEDKFYISGWAQQPSTLNLCYSRIKVKFKN